MITNNIITKLPFQQMDFAAAHERVIFTLSDHRGAHSGRQTGNGPFPPKRADGGSHVPGKPNCPRASEMLNIGRRTFTPEAVVPVADDAPACRGGDRSKPEIFAEGFLEKAEKKGASRFQVMQNNRNRRCLLEYPPAKGRKGIFQ
ncbi:hypothetical protein [Caldibacillus debilis]|uniref:hypothetical protein n=1 Tax=Caldibacillus debilis TaxID=301148 RepID=UPI0023F33855|nr:hypothetical protein [Caldibacillus debilis]